MRTLIVEDDFISRRLIQAILTPYGTCDVVVNGKEAVEAFQMSLVEGNKYDLVCLDIMMPEMDGLEVLREIREIERELEITGLDGVKVIMVTALDDFENIKTAFNQQCEAYLIKPIIKEKLIDTLKEIHLI
jgi:two-component system, chemotaxis family, chemotaxis protein CheY